MNLILAVFLFAVAYCKDTPKSDLDFYVELTNFPDDMFDTTLSAVTEGYQMFDDDMSKVVPHINNALRSKYPDKHWFTVVNYDQTAFRYNYSLSLTERTHNDRYSIGNLVGCVQENLS